MHPPAIGSTSRIPTYRHHPWNRPKAKNPAAFASSRIGIASRITGKYWDGIVEFEPQEIRAEEREDER